MENKGYYIKIEEKDKMYCFQLWYRGKQEMGNSIKYKTYDECKKGLIAFKEFLSSNNVVKNDKLVKIKKLEARKYIYQFYNEKGDILYTSRIIEEKKNCENSIVSTCKNLIGAEIK